jgi:predicted nucleic acid-binding protein
MIYFDTSALVKRYLKEDGSEIVGSIVTQQKVIATSKLAYPEMLSALMRKHRAGEIQKKPLDLIIGQFETDWEKLVIVEFHDELLEIIKSLIGKYPLRGADAVHLSSAMWLQQSTKARLTFITSDIDLLSAAQAEDLEIINPQE